MTAAPDPAPHLDLLTHLGAGASRVLDGVLRYAAYPVG